MAPGALERIQALGQTILESPGYLPASGLDLGLAGTEDAGPDLAGAAILGTVRLGRGRALQNVSATAVFRDRKKP